MMSDQERADYLIHLQHLIGELAILLDSYPVGIDQLVLQRAFDDLLAISERLYDEQLQQHEADQAEGTGNDSN